MKSVLYLKQPRNQPRNNSNGILLWKYRYCEGVTVTFMAIVALNAIEIMTAIRNVIIVIVLVVVVVVVVVVVAVVASLALLIVIVNNNSK